MMKREMRSQRIFMEKRKRHDDERLLKIIGRSLICKGKSRKTRFSIVCPHGMKVLEGLKCL